MKRHKYISIFRQVRRALAFALCLGTVQPGVLTAENGSATPSQTPAAAFQLSYPSKELFDEIVKASLNMEGVLPYRPQDPHTDFVAGAPVPREHPLVQMWWGNRPQLDLSVSGISFDFRKEATRAAAEEKVRVSILISPKGLVMTHTAVEHSKLAGGYRIPGKIGSQIHSFIPGANGSGAVALFPGNRRTDLFAGMICPRDFTGVEGGFNLDMHGFALDGVTVAFNGLVKGELLTGGGIGKAAARIETSARIAPSAPDSDRARSLNPRVDVRYHPVTPFTPPPLPKAREILEGAQLTLDLELPSSHSRRSSRTLVLWAKEVQQAAFEIPLPRSALMLTKLAPLVERFERRSLAHKGIATRVASGPCTVYAVEISPLREDYFGDVRPAVPPAESPVS